MGLRVGDKKNKLLDCGRCLTVFQNVAPRILKQDVLDLLEGLKEIRWTKQVVKGDRYR